MRVCVAPANVMAERIVQLRKAPVVHVRRAQRNRTQRWSLEGAGILVFLGLSEPPKVVEVALNIGAYAQVVKLIVGEERVLFADGMATGSVALLRIHK